MSRPTTSSVETVRLSTARAPVPAPSTTSSSWLLFIIGILRIHPDQIFGLAILRNRIEETCNIVHSSKTLSQCRFCSAPEYSFHSTISPRRCSLIQPCGPLCCALYPGRGRIRYVQRTEAKYLGPQTLPAVSRHCLDTAAPTCRLRRAG